MLPNTRHVPHREAPEATMAAIVDFVQRARVSHEVKAG
jgi:hypothetical protein